ncbi:hypothetical protein I4U23_009679 [Adineta vaga]|nr:hypothetical protein I4U23_009679 [Adineta vaga]
MENKTFIHISDLSSTTTNHSSNSEIPLTATSNSFVLSPIINTTVTTPTLQTLQTIPQHQSTRIDSDKNKNNTNKGSSRLASQSTFPIKQEQFDGTSLREQYSNARNILTSNQLEKSNPFPLTIASLQHNPRELLHSLSAISMANINGHLASGLNPSHLPENGGPYLYSGLPSDLGSNYKLSRPCNTDLPSPSNSSNSSNPSSSHHQGRRHDEGADPTRKRAVRLQKNRDAARECRRKKKEYIKCLEERVTGLETQNKALIEELRQLKELYCQREETNNTNNKTTTTNTR